MKANFINLNPDNLDNEHICCAIGDTKGDPQAAAKKSWLAQRFSEGLVFRRLDARGKVFIEYLPAEAAWAPVTAPGYLHINCFWVSGQYKGQGLANQLLDYAIADARAKGKLGLTVISSAKKKPFLSDPGYLKHKGFQVADQAAPWFELLYLPLDAGRTAAGQAAEQTAVAARSPLLPRFKDCCREGRISNPCMTLYYTAQCPHTAKYAPLLAELAGSRGQEFTLIRLDSREAAQSAPSPAASYSFFDKGRFITNEILSEKKFLQYLDQR